MKKLAFIVLASAALAACKKDGPDVTPVDLKVNVTHNVPLGAGADFPFSGVTVTIENLGNGSVTSLVADATGQATFAGIAAGQYDVAASITLSQADYLQLTGVDPGADVALNASLTSQAINVGFDTPIELELVSGSKGTFVFKQIYYGGSDTRDGAVFRDQFVELYNNTDDVLYADGLYIARLWGRQRPQESSHHYQANGQFDWSKSVDMPTNIDANRDYVYLRDLFRVPGSGTTYPVQPGESIIIAQNALNHKTPFTGHNDREYSVNNPDLTVDLSGADFEVYYGDIPGRTPFATDIDNPVVPNLEVVRFDGNDWILDANGRDSYVIFTAAEGLDVESLPTYYAPLLNAPGSGAEKYLQLPVSVLIDAVEVEATPAEDRFPKKLLPQFDAGYTFTTGGRYSSQSVMRKVQENIGGRRVLQDTNNSTADFVSIAVAPGAFAE